MGTRRLLLALILVMGVSWNIRAQVSAYSFSASSGTFDTLVGGVNVPDVLADTDQSGKLPIGFTFTFEGVAYDSVIATSDGFLSFNENATSAFTNDLDGASAIRRPLVAPLWDDLDGSGTDAAGSYLTTGTAPNRVFTFEWKRWQWNWSSSDSVITFQVKLYETTDVVEFHYKQEPNAVNSGSASIGMTGASTFLSLDGSGATPNVSSTTETTSISTKPATGQIYSFTPPSCLPPTALNVSNVTATGATLGWTSVAGGSSFEVENVTAGTSPTGTGTILATNSQALTGLTAATGYEFYVREICGAGDTSNWEGPFAYSTAYTAPYNEDFESLSDGNTGPFGNGWTSNPTSGFDWEAQDGTTTSSGTGPTVDHTLGTSSGIYIYTEATDGSAGDVAELYSPFVDVTPLTAPQLEFWYHRFGDDFSTGYIDVLSGGTWTTVDSLVGETQTANADAYVKKVVDLSTYTGIIQVRFSSEKIDFEADWAIDDVAIIETPSCLEPLNLTVTNITSSGAEFGWTSQSGASSWEVEVVTAGASATGSGTVVNANPYTASSLTDATDYEYYVREICGAGDTSVWAGPMAFTTLCNPFTATHTENFDGVGTGTLPLCWSNFVIGSSTSIDVETTTTNDLSAPNAIELYNSSSDNATDFIALVTPEYSDLTSQNNRIKFWLRGSSSTTNNDLIIGTMSDPTDETTFTPYDTITGIGNTYQEYTVHFDANYTLSDEHIVFRLNSTAVTFNTLYLDDYTYEPIPSCLIPLALNATNITSTSADLGWTSQSGASSWEVEIVAAGATSTGAGTVVSTNPYSVSSLSQGTAYDYYVREICAVGDSSVWAGPYTFVTSFVAPYTEDFESLSDGDKGTLLNGWTGNPSTGYAWEANSGTTGSSGTGPNGDHTTGTGIYMYTEATNGSSGNVAYLESPLIDVSPLTAPRMEFWYHRFGGDFETGYIEVNSGGTWTTVDSIVGADQNANADPYLLKIVDLSSYTGVIQVRFSSTKDDFEGDWAVDDVSIIEAPAVDASALAVTKPVQGCFTSSDTVEVMVQNFGSQTLDFTNDAMTVGVEVTGVTVQTLTTTVNTGTLAPGATMLVEVSNSFNMSAGGTYNFRPYTAIAADLSTSNDTGSIVTFNAIALSTIPSSVDFQGFTGSNLNAMFPDWNEGAGANAPAGTTSLWLNSSATQTAGFGTTTARVNLYTTSRNEWLVGPKFVPASNDSIYFKLAVTNWNNMAVDSMGSDDHVDLKISTDCGITWNGIVSFDQGSNLDTTLQQFSVSLDSWAGQEVMLAFHAQDGPIDDAEDYDFHIDDIYIGNIPAVEVAVDTILEPNTAQCQNGSTDVKVIVTNNGSQVQSNINVTVDLAGAATGSVTGTVVGPLAMGESDTITVGPVNITGAGSLDLTAYTAVTGDADLSNDTALASVVVNAAPSISIPDDSLCTGSSIQLNAGAGFTSYNWSNGGNTQILVVSAGGTYTVTVTNVNGCQAIDTVEVTEFATPTIDLGNDTAFCAGSAFNHTLDVTTAGATYLWDDNSTNATLNVTGAGTYFVEVTTGGMCTAYDTIIVTENALPNVTLNDTGYCVGSDVTLDAGAGFASYLWTDNSTAQTLTVSTASTVGVTVTDANGCENSATSVVSENALPVVNLGNDTTIKDGSTYTLDAGAGFASYLWSDNSTAQTLDVSASATVNVTVTDANGCEGTDEVEVTIWPVGIEDNADVQFNLFPNPNPGRFTIVNGGQDTEVNVEVININGQVVYNQVMNAAAGQQQQIDLSNIAKGMYVVNIKSAEKAQQFRMIVR